MFLVGGVSLVIVAVLVVLLSGAPIGLAAVLAAVIMVAAAWAESRWGR